MQAPAHGPSRWRRGRPWARFHFVPRFQPPDFTLAALALAPDAAFVIERELDARHALTVATGAGAS